jgi:phage terminase large subunit
MQIKFSKSLLLEPYRAMIQSDADIILVWGGRDSGKTYNIQFNLMAKAFEQVHKMVFARKVKDTVKGSMFDGYKAKFYELKAEALIRATKSPLEAVLVNGTEVLTRGFDDPMKIKGIEQPTVGWIEEADQCNEDDFDMLFSTMRSNRIKPQIILSFNPEVNAEGKNWIISRFMKGYDINEFYNTTKEIVQELEYQEEGKTKATQIKILSIHTTYRDNPYCPPQKRAYYESLKDVDYNKYLVWALGYVGQREVKRPFFVQFGDVMVKHHDFDPKLETWISFDFNVAPCTATISQQDYHKTFKRFIYEVRIGSSAAKASVYDVCDIIKQVIPKNTYLYITGDSTGKNSSALTKGDLMAYDIIMSELNLSVDNFFIQKKNISHKNSYQVVNKAFRQVEITFNPEMKYTLADLKFLEYDGENIMKKEAEKVGRGHLADCVRYDLHVNFLDL